VLQSTHQAIASNSLMTVEGTAVVYLAAAFNLGFAVFHLAFWRLFSWGQELPRLRMVNRGILQVPNICLVYFFTLTSCLLLFFPREVLETRSGRFLITGLGAFWLVRAVCQPIFFSLRHPLSRGLLACFIVGAGIHGSIWLYV
jgi:hypothetical protein